MNVDHKKEGRVDFTLTSSAFEEGGMIPDVFTCDDRDISPPLSWENAPDEAKSFTLICDDPDAPMGTWVHWVIFNIPADAQNLAEAIPPERDLANGAKQGMNDFGKIGYGGPCPPSGTHRYFFKLYALDIEIDLPSGATKGELIDAMQDHILEKAQLMCRYQR
jgi:Raf kinase inhibitor-like YbhB/YbcL family protein